MLQVVVTQEEPVKLGGQTYTSKSLTSASQDFHTIYEGPEIDLINVGWGINQNGQTGTSSDGFRIQSKW